MKVKLKYAKGICSLCDPDDPLNYKGKHKFIHVIYPVKKEVKICFVCYRALKKKVMEARGY